MTKIIALFIYILLNYFFVFTPFFVLAEDGLIDLKTNRTWYAIPPISKPDYRLTIPDPTFNTKLTRISGDPGSPIITKDGQTIGTWGDVTKHHYSKDQPWNADGTLLHLTRNEGGSPSSLFLDGETYEVLFTRSIPGTDNRWHQTDPNLKVYVSNNRIGYFNVKTGTNQVLRTFTEYSRLDIGPYEGNLSYGGGKIVLYGDNTEVFAYDLINDIKHSVKQAAGIDWASISPLGNYVVIMYSDTDTQVFDLNMNPVSQFTMNHNHYDLGIDGEGNEVASGISKSTIYDGTIIKHRLYDGQLTQLINLPYAIHTSTRSDQLLNWSYSSFHPRSANSQGDGFNDEIVAVKMDGSFSIRRFGNMHNRQTDYLTEAMPVPSRDGSRVLFSSNWNSTTGRPVQAYILDARNNNTVTCLEDIDANGVIDHQDARQILIGWTDSCSGCPEDLNTDTKVNAFDVAMILKNWGTCQ